MMQISKTVGLALSGGAARGLAHIGILARLEEAGLRPDYIAASSAGAIVGALYASGVSLPEMQEVALTLKWTDLFSPWPTFSSLLSSKGLARVLHKHCHVTRFEELQIPLAVVATDFETGASVAFTSGDLIPAVQASASIPIVLPPVRIGDRYYIDGGVAQEMPVPAVRALGADIVVACDVHHNAVRLKRPTHFLALAVHLGRMIATLNTAAVKPDADLVIEVDAHDIGLTELHKVEELIRRGRQAAEMILPELLGRRLR
jgi:NTE family protein